MAVEEVEAGPVPAHRLGREVGARPFMIEPRAAADLTAVHFADHAQQRLAVVVARFLGPQSLAAVAVLALEHRLVVDEKGQIEIELARRDLGVVAVAFEKQLPVVDPDAGALGLGLGERVPGARSDLVVQQAGALRIRERGVREEHLARVEAARVVALLFRPRAEEGDLEAERPIEPSGDVPPLGAEIRMRAMIAREFERARRDYRVLDLPGPGQRRKESQRQEGSASHASIMLSAWPTASSSPTSSPPALSRATSSPSFPTVAAFRIAPCRRSRASSISPRPPSSCRPRIRSTRRTCVSSRLPARCPSPGTRPWPRPRCSRACAVETPRRPSCSRKRSDSCRWRSHFAAMRFTRT